MQIRPPRAETAVPMSPQPSRPASPKDAASVVIVRRDGAEPRVLLGRRPPGQRFMPDIYVFPGGGVEAHDASARVARGLRAEVAALLERRSSPAAARALAVAGLRETFEETGLAFGELGAGGFRPGLDSLDYIARAITPASSPVRYHARFFLTDARNASGEVRSNGELLDLQFVSISRALELPIIDVTAFVLREVERRLRGQSSLGIPLLHYRNGSPHIRYDALAPHARQEPRQSSATVEFAT